VDAANAFALCSECFRGKEKRRPPKLPEFRIPGVMQVKADNLVQLAKLKDEASVVDEEEKVERLTAESKCEFRALNPGNGHWYVYSTHTKLQHARDEGAMAT
jgi:hypothetical protein